VTAKTQVGKFRLEHLAAAVRRVRVMAERTLPRDHGGVSGFLIELLFIMARITQLGGHTDQKARILGGMRVMT
jgi:hypothetical protein